MTIPTFCNENEFTIAVKELFEKDGWKPFHIDAQAYQTKAIPAGLPDLIIRRRDSQGKTAMIIAELKNNDNKPTLQQQEFLEDFATYIPTYVFRYRDWNYIEDLSHYGPPKTTGNIMYSSSVIDKTVELLPPQQKNLTYIAQQMVNDFNNPNFNRGDLATLRRIDIISTHYPPIFWRLISKYNLTNNKTMLNHYALIMYGIAQVVDDSTVSVGKALFSIKYSEKRLNSLLKSKGSMLHKKLYNIFKWLYSAKQSVNLNEIATFIINDSETERNTIACDYYQEFCK